MYCCLTTFHRHRIVILTSTTANDIVTNHLRSDTNSTIQIRNVISSSHSCYALYTNGHSVGNHTTTTNSNDYLIPNDGVILSTGNPLDINDNDLSETSTNFNMEPAKATLESQLTPSNSQVYDPCYIQFEFMCPSSTSDETGEDDNDEDTTLDIAYVFGSEEYSNDDAHNDIFGIFLNEQNIALVPDSTLPVTINNINNQRNSKYYINNELTGRVDKTSPFPNIEADGFTITLHAIGKFSPNKWNTIKLVIGDVDDGELDSWVLIESGAFTCKKKPLPEGTWEASKNPASSSGDVQTGRRGLPIEFALMIIIMLGLGALALPAAGLMIYNKGICQKKGGS